MFGNERFTDDMVDEIAEHRSAVDVFDNRLRLWVKDVASELAKIITEAHITPEEVNEYSIDLTGADPRLAVMLKATFDDATISVDPDDGEVDVRGGYSAEAGYSTEAYFPNEELLAPIEDVAKSYMLKLTEYIDEQS